MKKFVKYFMFVLMVSAVVLSGCSKSDDDEPAPPPAAAKFDVLKDYMVANSMDVSDIIADWIISAQDVNAKADFFIIDIRKVEDFDLGHIAGASPATLGTILDVAQGANGKTIVVVCYTGQAAGHAVIGLRLSGYTDAKVMKFGMSAWRDDLAGKWETNKGDAAVGHASWIVAPGAIATASEYDAPVIESSFTEGADLLAERVDEMLANGFNGVGNGDVLGNPAGYYINNYWDEGDVQDYGNIDGAYRLKPFTLADGTYLNLDASQTVVTYCWTGQTSSMMTAYLYVMGYTAKSLTYGANGMIYSALQGHTWSLQGLNYDVVPTK